MVPLNDLVLTRRVSKELGDYRVKNLTFAALACPSTGSSCAAWGKVRYVVANAAAPDLLDRVILVDELPLAKRHLWLPLALRRSRRACGWAVLAPFGWTDTMLQDGQEQPTLLDFIPAHAEEGVLSGDRHPLFVRRAGFIRKQVCDSHGNQRPGCRCASGEVKFSPSSGPPYDEMVCAQR